MIKFIIGIVLFWLTLKLAHYLRSITPAYNRPNLFRNPLAFTALNILMLALPVLAGWFVLAALFGFRAPFGVGDYALLPSAAMGARVQCMLGTTRCIKSQGTEIPSKQVIAILDRCREFTFNDLGRVALRLSHKEIYDHSGGRITPIVKAWHAFSDLYDSPLAFERKRKAQETKYFEIERACQILERDFNDDSKWTR